jgi:predicted O-methyltransferase YrrM
MVNLELSNPNPPTPTQPAKNFKYFIKRSYLTRLLLIPYRISYALGIYLPTIAQIFKWGFASREFTNYTYDLTETNLVYLAQMLSLVTSVPISEIEKYLKEPQEDERLLAHIIETTNNSDLKTIADAQCRFGRRLGWYALVRALKPKTIVETGIDKGLGSVLLCSALSKNAEEGYEGRYFGTDINPDAGYLLSEPYSNYGEILYGDSIASLEKFDRPIDLFINDSDHSGDYEYQEYLTIQDKLAPNAIILGDNAEVTDRLSLFSKETGRDFLFFAEKPKDHWCPGSGIGISFKRG